MWNEANSLNWLFRVAAKAENGGGHVSRSLVLARDMQANITFSISECSPYRSLIENHGFKTVSAEQEEPYYDGVWVDIYNDNFDHYRSKTNCLAIIEDHRDLYDRADIYVRPYPGVFANRPSGIELSGFDFSLIDAKFFSKRQNKIASDVKTVTVFMGRYDSVNATASVLEVINDLPINISVCVVAGSGAAHLDKIKKYLSQEFGHKYKLYIDLPDLCDVFADCDLLVLSGGVALLEACAIGCPAVVLNIADNQRILSKYLSSEGAIAYAGSHSQFEKSAFADVLLQNLSFVERERISNNAKTILKNSGVSCVASVLMENSMKRGFK